MDGRMDSHAEEEKDAGTGEINSCCNKCVKIYFRANVRSAVRVFTGEAGETFALL